MDRIIFFPFHINVMSTNQIHGKQPKSVISFCIFSQLFFIKIQKLRYGKQLDKNSCWHSAIIYVVREHSTKLLFQKQVNHEYSCISFANSQLLSYDRATNQPSVKTEDTVSTEA